MRITIAQVNSTVGDLKGNTEKIIECIKKASLDESDIIVFPELVLCGYPPEDLLLKSYFIEDCQKEFKRIIEKCKNIVAVVGFPYKEKASLYNSAGIICKGRIVYIYKKCMLPNYGVFDEKRYFTPGNELPLFVQGNIRWTINICENVWIKEGPIKRIASYGRPHLIINISASPYHKGKLRERELLLQAQAKKLNALLIYCNLVGGQDELVFDGGSLVVSPEGRIFSRLKQFEEDILTVDLNEYIPYRKKRDIREKKGFKKIRLPVLSRQKEEKYRPRLTPGLKMLEEVYSALVLGLRDYVRKNGFEKVIFGLSGGIDSTLTALIAVDALGKENVVALSMPSPYTSRGTLRDKRILVKNLGIPLLTVPITPVFKAYLKVLEPFFKGKEWNVTEENIQARIRGNLLMAFSNKFGYLVLTTGNKSETSVGYCTLYGDMAGGFAVIKDVPKGLVYKLVEYRNNKAEGKLVPKSIFTRPPSAELRKGQQDEDTLPPYPVLDRIIEAYIEQDKGIKEIVRKGISAELVKEVVRMIDRNEYKRRQTPPGIKITPKAFGRDHRMPITNRYGHFV